MDQVGQSARACLFVAVAGVGLDRVRARARVVVADARIGSGIGGRLASAGARCDRSDAQLELADLVEMAPETRAIGGSHATEQALAFARDEVQDALLRSLLEVEAGARR